MGGGGDTVKWKDLGNEEKGKYTKKAKYFNSLKPKYYYTNYKQPVFRWCSIL